MPTATSDGRTPRPTLIAVTAAIASSLACTPAMPVCTETKVEYALVEYRTGIERGIPPRVEISDTESYRRDRSAFRAAAIRLPDSCLSKGAVAVTGVSREDRTETILATQCGVWLAELERALSQRGFRVTSWDALRQLERQKGISTYEAAKELGAEIVFVFNSLEASPVSAGAQAGASFRYFSSNPMGDRLAPLPLDEQTRREFKEFIGASVGRAAGSAVVALSSTLDSTAINTTNGEAIWFYRWTVTSPVKSRRGMQFLFGRIPGTPWRVAVPERQEPSVAKVETPSLLTEDVEETQVSGSPEDPYAAERLALFRAAANDFVTRFHTGGQ